MTAATSRTLEVRPGDGEAVEQVEEWFRTYKATGDPAIRERIILAHLGLADRLAARYHPRGVAADDLVQAARVGRVAAVNRYDPDRANPFVVYAIACIRGELRRHLRDTSWRVHVARPLKEQALQVIRARDALTAALGRSPTLAEIAARLGIAEDQVTEALEAIGTRSALSLDEPIDGMRAVSIGTMLPAPGDEVEVEDRLALPGLIGSLSELERRAVVLRFFKDLKQEEIGAELGHSQMYVSRLLRRALGRMREQLGAD